MSISFTAPCAVLFLKGTMMSDKDFDECNAQKALELCFENSEDMTTDEVLNAAKKTYDFLMGESHHFQEHKEELVTEQFVTFKEFLDDKVHKMKESMREKEEKVSIEEELVKTRLKALIPYSGRSREIGLLRAYEDVYGKFNSQFDHLLSPNVNVFG
jgi:hypothetical protein